MEDGYEFFAKRQLVTLFSAPNYCGEFDNAGAMMSVDETLMCSFQILKVLLTLFMMYFTGMSGGIHIEVCLSLFLSSFNLTNLPFSLLIMCSLHGIYKMNE